MASGQATSIPPALKHRLLYTNEFSKNPPPGAWLEDLIAASEDEDIAFWVATTHGLRTSTVAAHLRRTPTYSDPNLRVLLSANPEAPVEAMPALPVNEHFHYGLQRFIERHGFSHESDVAAELLEYTHSELPLGQVGDVITSPAPGGSL